MNLLTGTIREISESGQERVGKVSVNGAIVHVPLLLIPDAKVGDEVLVESGVAIARVEQPKEQNHVSGNSR
ncbi:MAG: HypC/HybG/HupF family hydrogenase formation chaperone [Ignavibacteriales bacterium]|nr:HypC/HybG/HupF family hydrogenase formation chaperone [Ignavibacteriales bacterium]